MRKVIALIGHHASLNLLINDLDHVAFAQEFLSDEMVMLGDSLVAGKNVIAGNVAIQTVEQIKPTFTLLAIEHLTENGTLSVRNEVQAQLLVAVSDVATHTVILLPSRPLHGEKRFAVGELSQNQGAVTPQIVAAEYYARLGSRVY